MRRRMEQAGQSHGMLFDERMVAFATDVQTIKHHYD